jgi:hypothetical protein
MLHQGEFPGVIHQPSKYAARIAQAFTATDPSVRITRNQWEEVEDLGTKPYYFTDGVGTISQELGDRIWKTLCDARRDHGKRAVKPSAVGDLIVFDLIKSIDGFLLVSNPFLGLQRGRRR